MSRFIQILKLFCVSVLITWCHFGIVIVDGAPSVEKGAQSLPGEERGGHFEGDIVLPQVLSSGLRSPTSRWPNAVVIYQMDPNFTADELDVINGAMREISEKTCVQFSQQTNETAYVKIKRGGLDSGCWSHLGFRSTVQEINLEPQSSPSGGHCIHHGVVIHEILHTLGFHHEQSRTDRDEFVTINQANIRPDIFDSNFKKYGAEYITDFDISYDYSSIMHYGPFAFALNPSVPTITPKRPGVKLGQREKLSEKDVQKVRRMYKIELDRVCLPFTMDSVAKMIKHLQDQIDEIREEKFTRRTSCSSIFALSGMANPLTRSKKQRIYPHGNGASLEVLCDFETDGGGWTIIQKRTSGPKQEFQKNWNEYSNGFGSISGNFWLGLETIRALTKNGDQELRIELEDFEGEKRFAEYSNFSVSDASDFYRLTIGRFSGTAGDSMLSYSLNGMRFTTKDKDNDGYPGGNCADARGGAGWWFNVCGYSNLNGLYFSKGETVPSATGVYWYDWKGYYYSLAKSEMKIRPRKS